MSKRIGLGTGISVGAIMALPATAAAEDFQVTNLNDSGAGSLRQALLDANDTPSADRVLFKSKLSGKISLESGPLEIYDSVEIVGPGARDIAVSGAARSRVFQIIGEDDDEVSISGLTIRDGSADYGSAISNLYTNLTLSGITITANETLGQAAVVHHSGGPYIDSGDLSIDSSTISNNVARGAGPAGALIVLSDADITNSTISGNSADGPGGGAYVQASVLDLVSSTVATNRTGDRGGGIYSRGSEIRMRGSIVSDNTAALGGNDLFGPFEGSFNLIEDPNGNSISGSNNILGTDPRLKALANNGGPTDTQALRKTSPARETGPGDAPSVDQRGLARQGQPDIGAYEFTK